MIDEQKFKKNSEILKIYWISEIDDTLENIKNYLKHFFSGIWGWLFNKFVVFIFNFFLSSEVREKSIAQLSPILEGAKILDSNNLDDVIEQFFNDFKVNDLGYIRCKHKHKKFPELVEKMRQNFIARITGTHKLLLIDGECYSELVRNAFQSKDEATKVMTETLDLAKDSLDFTVENKIIKISPLIRDQTISVLYKEIEYKRKVFQEKLELIFSGENF
ncbi:MAG: hypothetical protein ACFFCM_06475 [Promethearchaeota archaeon]